MPSEKDRFDGDNCFVCVNPNGRRFHLYGDDAAEIDIEDVANAISKQVRWMGHLKGDCWYSVAEHCVLVSWAVRLMGGTLTEQFAALLHDASEAYLSDIAAPFKRELGGYYDKELLITTRLMAKWDVPNNMPPVVRNADWLMLWIEAKHLVVDDIATCKTWVGWDEWGDRAMALERKHPIELTPFQWDHRCAKSQFVNEFHRLSAALEKERAAA